LRAASSDKKLAVVIPPEHAHRRLVSKPFRLSDIEAALREFSAQSQK